MFVVPADTLVTIPDTELTVVALLVHVPPIVPSDNDVVAPRHIFVVPVIEAGSGLMVIIIDLEQPVAAV